MINVHIPDVAPIPVNSGLTVEQVRRNLIALGYAQVETATATVDPRTGDIRFNRAVGGEKGL